ncbi:MAG: hypothetical protein WBB67_09705 [bacterium]
MAIEEMQISGEMRKEIRAEIKRAIENSPIVRKLAGTVREIKDAREMNIDLNNRLAWLN